MPESVTGSVGILTGVGPKDSFQPFYATSSKFTAYLSTTGSGWDIAYSLPIGLSSQPKETYRLKCTWDGDEYAWYMWRDGWSVLKKLPCKIPVKGGHALQLGTNRGVNYPFGGTINLARCYIIIGGKLWWEGVKGAYKNANR